MSTVIALRDIWLVELTPVNVQVKSVNRTITGAHCMPARRPEVRTIITVFHLLDVSNLVTVSILIIGLHSLIIRKVANVRNQLDDFSKHSRRQAPSVNKSNAVNNIQKITPKVHQVEVNRSEKQKEFT
ncbi:hypothetical protein DPMN_185247 [Dreissena polymorpha]|uniref:Uncharacterized protein n=1 Tax=Dreissena polymorpha TaxID=45954 RepID=A0A9D4I5D1_DREPO|nr:hypothetical protein DPMN_185247 [Dreissena polymorpha]